MKKNVLYIVFVLLIILLVVCCLGCQTKKTVPHWNYTDAKNGFACNLPSKWLRPQLGMKKILIVMRPLTGTKDTFHEQCSIITEDLPDQMTLDAYVEGSQRLLKSHMTSYQITQEQEFNGAEKGKLVVATMQAPKSKMVEKIAVYYFTKGAKGYAITCIALPTTYPKYQSTFDALARSFTFLH